MTERTSQERQENKPWDAEGVSRATWYRRHPVGRHRETIAGPSLTSHEPETETETAGETTETAAASTAGETTPVQSPEAAKEMVEKVSGDGEPPETLPSAPNDPWALSAADLARHAERYQIARKEKGEAIANRALRWGLQDAGVLYEQLEREVDRIRALAGC